MATTATTTWRRDLGTAVWVALGSALLAPLVGLVLTALALDIAAVQPDESAAGYRSVGRFVGFLAAVPYTYFLAVVFMGVPSAACGFVLGLVLAWLARQGRAGPLPRAAAGAAVAACFALMAGWLPDDSEAGLPYPLWSVVMAAGAVCGLAFRAAWLARRVAAAA